jgi:plastocyanin
MRLGPGALAALILIVALGLAVPVASGAAPSAVPAAKHRCKHNAKHHRKRKKRCRKKANGTSSPADNPGAPSGPPGRLLATERELSLTQLQLQLSRASLPAGTTIVEQYNAGSDPHNLILERKGAVAFAFPTLDPGLNQRQTVKLARGTWTLYCSILDHRDLGMQATLSVN